MKKKVTLFNFLTPKSLSLLLKMLNRYLLLYSRKILRVIAKINYILQDRQWSDSSDSKHSDLLLSLTFTEL